LNASHDHEQRRVAPAIIFASLFGRSTIALLGDELMAKLVVRQAIPYEHENIWGRKTALTGIRQ